MKKLLLVLIVALVLTLVGCSSDDVGPMGVDDVKTLEDGIMYIGQQALAKVLPFPDRTQWIQTEIREQAEWDGELLHLVYLVVDTATSQGDEERQGWVVYVVYRDDQPLTGEPVQVTVHPTSDEMRAIRERFNWPSE